jgi:hypothetical protein
MFVIVAYIIVYIVRTLSDNDGRPLQESTEHFTVEADKINGETCEQYQLRQEVINIFELYMGRKATPEEIEKYSKMSNIQDILVAITTDFQLSSTEVQEKKPQLETMRKPCQESDTAKIVYDETIGDNDLQNANDTQSTENARVSIPLHMYNDLKMRFEELDQHVKMIEGESS